MKYQPAMWNRPNMTTVPRRPGAPSSTSRWTARSHVARCESTAPFDTPVEPLVRNTLLASSLLPDAGERRGRRAVGPTWRGDEHVEPERLGHRAATSS